MCFPSSPRPGVKRRAIASVTGYTPGRSTFTPCSAQASPPQHSGMPFSAATGSRSTLPHLDSASLAQRFGPSPTLRPQGASLRQRWASASHGKKPTRISVHSSPPHGASTWAPLLPSTQR
eukprot:5164534-Pyramimonas_sp.AAC.1